MAGHSQFKNIMYRKGAQDARRSKLFSKLARELSVAARAGLPDPANNARLRTAVATARAANMTKDAIERAIKRGTGGDGGAAFEEVRYEGYAPGGVAVIVEALTDNRNRTAAEVRAAFSRHGGNLGEAGSVNYMFERVGTIHYPAAAASADEMLEAAVEAGAEDVESNETGHEITCAPDRLNDVREALEARLGGPDSAALAWKPHTTVAVEEPVAGQMIGLLQTLDDNDDVQQIAANYALSDDLLARLSA